MTWKNYVDPNRPQMRVWRMRIASWIPNATNTHSGYIILIAVPLQEWFHALASMLQVHCLPCYHTVMEPGSAFTMRRDIKPTFLGQLD
jgi:hypothetical protein